MTILEFEEYELPIAPFSVTGIFDYRHLPKIVDLCREFPEYHIVSLPEDNVMINTCVPGSDLFCLAEGDANPNLLWDPEMKVDERYLQSLNSIFRSRFPNSILAA
jgi:hypothetical protein